MRRIKEHKRLKRGFTSKYNVDELVYFEIINNLILARKREKQLKNLVRRKKLY
jgi:putative endonuclease